MRPMDRRSFLSKSALGLAGLSAGNLFGGGLRAGRVQEDPAVGYYDHPAFPVIDAHCHIPSAMHPCFPAYMDVSNVKFAITHGYWKGPAYDVAAVTDIKTYYADRFAAFYAPVYGSTDANYANNRPDTHPTDAYLSTTLPNELEQFMTAGGANALGLKFWRDVGASVYHSGGQLLHLNDTRLDPVYQKAEALGAVVSIHVCGWCQYLRNEAVARYPNLKFVFCHWGNWPDNFTELRSTLNTYPNVMVDISPAGGWPNLNGYTAQQAHDFFVEFQDRLMFGTDFVVLNRTDCGSLDWWTCFYQTYYRYCQTWDTTFDGTGCDITGWSGIGLGEDVLRKLLWSNAYNFYGLNRLIDDLPSTGQEKGVSFNPAKDSQISLVVPGYRPATVNFTFSEVKNSPVLSLYGLQGDLLQTFSLPRPLAGPVSISWNGRSQAGAKVGAGVYLVRLNTGADLLTRKLVLTK